MKRCPACNRIETDDALVFCRTDGTALVNDSSSLGSETGTARPGSAPAATEIETSILPYTTDAAMSRGTGPTTVLPAQPPSSTTRELKTSKRRWVLIAGVLLIAAVFTVAGYFYLTRKDKAAIQSIAVMPFVNESGNADVEYLSDGMTETLISSLSQLPNLNVKARSSVFRYKGKDTNPQTIGKELNVQAILNGRVNQRGDQLTLTLELVNAQTENVIWSEQYNRKQADLVTLQSEIARDVSSKLKTKLSGADEAKVTKTYTASPEAYQIYLKGRFYWNKRTIESLKQAVEFYKQAIEKDPNYALAYSGLAETYVLYPLYSVASPKDSMPQAKAAALRALEIDASLAEAHGALGKYLNFFEFDRLGGEKEFRRAIELNPNYATAHQWLAFDILAATKRFDEAVAEITRAEELDPLSLVIITDASGILIFARRYDDAIAQAKHALALDPGFPNARYSLGLAYDLKGLYAEAIAEFRKALALNDDPFVKALLARSLAKSGGRGEAMKLVEQLKSEAADRYIPSYCFVIAYTALGEKEEALVWMERDIAERSPFASYSAVERALDDLRGEARFKEMLKRLNLPE